MTHEISCLVESQDGLGEAPLWVEEEQALYWADHVKYRMERWDAHTGKVDVWQTPGPVGSFAMRRGGGMVGASDAGFLAIDLAATTFTTHVDPEADWPENRFNDGKCDRQGRFWCGSMNKSIEAETGGIYCLAPDWTVSRHAHDFEFKVSNGTAFSLDGRTMYFSDTLGNQVWSFDFDPDEGRLSNRRPFFSTADRPGMVDGATVDADDCYWCSLVAGGKVLRLDPKGRIMLEIDMPVPRPTCPTFGGPNYDRLFITSQRLFMTDEELEAYPLAGNLFVVDGLGIKGVPEERFAG
ncbi:MAG: SMP-30/gluconolactonase/LRE family protein [Pseudomonadota bacterium]